MFNTDMLSLVSLYYHVIMCKCFYSTVVPMTFHDTGQPPDSFDPLLNRSYLSIRNTTQEAITIRHNVIGLA